MTAMFESSAVLNATLWDNREEKVLNMYQDKEQNQGVFNQVSSVKVFNHCLEDFFLYSIFITCLCIQLYSCFHFRLSSQYILFISAPQWSHQDVEYSIQVSQLPV